MKPFDLEAAKRGDPVCTRDGCAVRILAFDLDSKFPIAVAISKNKENGPGYILSGYNASGRVLTNFPHRDDLMMVPKKRTVWAVWKKPELLDDMGIPSLQWIVEVGSVDGLPQSHFATPVEWEE